MSASLIIGRPVALCPSIFVAVAMEEMVVLLSVAAVVVVAVLIMVVVAVTIVAVIMDRGILVHQPRYSTATRSEERRCAV